MTHERIGILVVHGIGECKRFDHVRGVARDLAEHFKAIKAGAVSVVDHSRDPDYPLAPAFGAAAPAPITVNVSSAGTVKSFAFHEVWWADLAERRGILDAIGFWLWGLGQWGAPIYRDLVPNPKAAVALPGFDDWRVTTEVWTRARLAFAALLTLFSVVTLSLAKRLLRAVSGFVPGATIVVQYLGDVQTLEMRARPGRTRLSDPGHPPRVPIRRRMIAETVAMATRGYDRWHILAHSLGTVIAYNALTEVEQTLPNYLTEAQWQALPAAAKREPERTEPYDTRSMMPARPPWLNDLDVIRRTWLFERFAGFVSYGSPLNKFAAIWPLIVATSTAPSPFAAGTPWLNIYTAFDPVAGPVDAYRKLTTPSIVNVVAPPALPLVSHLGYLTPKERSARGAFISLRQKLARWLIDPTSETFSDDAKPRAQYVVASTVNLVIAVVLALLATAVVAAAIMAAGAAFGEGAVPGFGRLVGGLFAVVLAAAVAIVLFAGQWRWMREAARNLRSGRHDRDERAADPATPDDKRRADARMIAFLTVQRWTSLAAFLMAMAGFTVAALAAAFELFLFAGNWLFAAETQCACIAAAAGIGTLFGLFSMAVQASIARLHQRGNYRAVTA
jgi:hypothetical protein